MMIKEVCRKDVEDMLYDLVTVKAELRDIEIEIEILKNEYTGIAGAGNNEKPSTPTNQFNSNVENEVTSREQQLEYLQRLHRSKDLEIQRTENMLTTLKADEKLILEHLYFKRYDAQKTAALLDVSYQTVVKKKKLSISSLTRLLNQKKLTRKYK